MKNAKQTMSSPLRLGIGLAIGLLWLADIAPALAATKTPAAPQPVSAEVQQACTPDAMRLCNEFIPDAAKVGACMNRKRAQVSPACRAAIAASAPPHVRHHHHS